MKQIKKQKINKQTKKQTNKERKKEIKKHWNKEKKGFGVISIGICIPVLLQSCPKQTCPRPRRPWAASCQTIVRLRKWSLQTLAAGSEGTRSHFGRYKTSSCRHESLTLFLTTSYSIYAHLFIFLKKC